MKCVFAVLIVLCSVLRMHARPSTRLRSRPLDNSETWNNIIVMAKDAQSRDHDHETRLIPVISSDKLKGKDVCCLNVRILNYYLKHILPSAQHKRLHKVQTDLDRVAKDLEPHCNSTQSGMEHVHIFEQNLIRAGEMYKNNATAQNKAVGETDILFHYLYESCNSSNAS